MSAERLQKVLAAAGIASRRDCEELIAAGRVTVNGKVMHTLGARVNPANDQILVDNAPIQTAQPRSYMLLNKPTGVISTAEDTHDRPTVVEMVASEARLFPVGRLDQDSEGLILLTDDGALTQRLTHPSYQVEKEYRALLDRTPDADALRDWREGVELDGEQTAPAWVDVQEKSDDGTWVRIVLQEGRKRQIREVAKLLGYEVKRLVRVREGSLLLGELPLGESRPLTEAEIEGLWQHVGGRIDDQAEDQPTRDRPSRSRPSIAGRNVRARQNTDEARPDRATDDQRPATGDRRPRNDDRRPATDERPQRENYNRDERPQREGYNRDDRPQRGYGNRDERPQREGYRDRPSYGNRDQNRGYGSRDERPQRENRDRPSYGSRDERPQRDNRGPRDQNRGYGNRDERPQREGYRDRPSYGNRDQNRGYGSRDERPQRENRDRPSYGNRDQNRGYGSRDERPQRENRDRPSYGSRDERPQRDNRGPRDQNRGYGNRDERPQREGYRDRPSYGNRDQNRGYGSRDERPQRENRDRPSYGSRDERPQRDNRGPRDQNRGYGNRDERPQREGYRDRPSYGNRDQNRGYGSRDERPRGTFGSRPFRRADGRTDRGTPYRSDRPSGPRPGPTGRSRSDLPPRPRTKREDEDNS